MFLCCFLNIISFESDATKYDVSQPSDKANVYAAIVDLATRFSLILVLIGATLLYLSLNRIIKLPWLPLFGRLLKLASEYNLILSDSMSNMGMQIYVVVVGVNFNLLAAIKSETVASFTRVLVSQTKTLISSFVIPATQFRFSSIFSKNGYFFLRKFAFWVFEITFVEFYWVDGVDIIFLSYYYGEIRSFF